MMKNEYYNEIIVRLEELFYHEMSDCAPFKVELVGVDYIQSCDIKGDSVEEIITACIREIKAAGLVKEMQYNIGGRGIKLELVMRDCIHLPKEIKIRKEGIHPYICPPANMVLDQLIEKLGHETNYIATMNVDETKGECQVLCAIYKDEHEIGKVCNWHEE